MGKWIGKEAVCCHCFRELPADVASSCPYCGYGLALDEERYPLALPRGTILDRRFYIGHVLGQGGFGITYTALDLEGRRRAAVKEYLPEMIAVRIGEKNVHAVSGQREDSFRYGMQCFLKEAQTLAQFRENAEIVHVYHYFEANGTAYFVMDYVEGISFQKYIQNHGGKISWQDAQRLLFPIMDALEAVHGKGIIHRDATPDNILVTRDGTAKLLDFGAARYSLGDQSRSLDVVLKHGFAPKEQYTRHGRQGPYTDVYTLAATFYYAVTGRRPPDSIDRLEQDGLVLPGRLGIQLPERVEKAVAKGLSVQPRDRYQNMAAFKQGLQHLSTGDAEATQKKINPAKIGLAMAAALVLSVAKSTSLPAVFSAYTVSENSSETDFDKEDADHNRRGGLSGDEDSTIGNITEGGLAAEDGRYSYYATVGGLLKVAKDTGAVKILDQSFAESLNVYDGWIYYLVSGTVFRVPADGSKKPQKVSVQEKDKKYASMYIDIAEAVVYLTYESSSSSFTLLCADLDNWNASELVSGISWNAYTICGGWVYYQNAEDNYFYKTRADGTGKRTCLSRLCLRAPIVSGGWIYGYTPGNSICRIALDGSTEETICKNCLDSSISGMNIKDGRLYFYNIVQAAEKGSVFVMNLDGTELQELYTASKAGDYFYSLNFLENEMAAGYCEGQRLTGTVVVNLQTGEQVAY